MTVLQTIECERRGKVAVITLNRPNDAHALDRVMASELAAVAASCYEDKTLRAVVLTGSGRFFCAGGDVKSFVASGDHIARDIKALVDDLNRAVSTFSRMDAALIVAVNGIAAGGGFGLAVCGDLVVASESASFTMSYSHIGLSPDGGSTYLLPRLIGLRRAQELMFTNRRLTAAEALEWGLVNKVTTTSSLMNEAMQWAALFESGAAGSQSAVKKLLMTTFDHGLETQLELEGRHIAGCAGSPDGREGMSAFVEKRRPKFA